MDYSESHVDLGDIQANLKELQEAVEEAGQNTQHSLQAVVTALEKDRSNIVADALVLVAVGLVLGSWSGSKLDRFSDRLYYSLSNDTEWANVHVDRRPSDCDFLHSPIGIKNCSYTKSKLVYGASDRRDDITKAKTPEEAAVAKQRPNMALVWWEKKEKP